MQSWGVYRLTWVDCKTWESVLTALLTGRDVSDSFVCRILEKSHLSSICSCDDRAMNWTGKVSLDCRNDFSIQKYILKDQPREVESLGFLQFIGIIRRYEKYKLIFPRLRVHGRSSFSIAWSYNRLCNTVYTINEWMNECVFIYHISHIVSRRFTILIEWDERQLVMAPLAATIGSYLISLAHPTHAWNVQWNYR